MAVLKELKVLVAIELPTKRSECIGLTIPGVFGLNSASNKPWHIAKQLNSAGVFHTVDSPLTQSVVDGLMDTSCMSDPDYATYCFKLMTVHLWVEDGVEQCC